MNIYGMDLKKIWNRRFKSMLIWFIGCIGLLISVKYLQFDKEIVLLIIEKSAWIFGLVIIGLSGTDLIKEWISKNK